jgi:alkylation response protein AidB-like acyl-CoA dehydrogenase
MTGEAEFGEMFFDNLHIPDKMRIGEVGRGWYVAMTTLAAERGGGGGGGMMGGAPEGRRQIGAGIMDMVELAKTTKRYGKRVWDDAHFRQAIVQIAIETEAMRSQGMISMLKLRAAKQPPGGNEVSISKNFSAEMRQRRGELMMDIIGAYSQMMRGSPRALEDGDLVYTHLRAKGATIEMGTSEINRNIIAERILGLPR